MATFRLFAYLPPELQDHVWELAVESREVRIHQREDATDSRESRFVWLYLADRIPGVLHACRASRSVAESKNYTKVFYPEPASKDRCRYTWVNFDVDTVCIHENAVWRLISENRKLVRQLTFDSDDICDLLASPVLHFAPLIKRLTILLGEPIEGDALDFEGEHWSPYITLFQERERRTLQGRRNDKKPRRRALVDVRMVDPTGEEINPANWQTWKSDWQRWWGAVVSEAG